ncbi:MULTISPECIES: AI-2E family transporter [unclassified Janthinobacterium]|uniref:AI-2E family transporter n=1 Tax=unclassified Janthinobacterium TaxID=2610881 RepID=UPI00160C60D1|nr:MULTISPECIES: AI-2E family transporter [unclassified Janthinobacterium]MBB5369274.1 putative PurR-regulated permease PerM [Janthinobacterium sp. K2C7]MBB5381190.1 putative PurR-regulated permease PerM [Janthinobacterium sp. K2Li3]MBB5387657.1 putative PurR-regulated permease PerM [Janthinobacterium sp. K2E3]
MSDTQRDIQRDIVSAGFSLALIALTAFVMQRFFLPLVWAGILCVATWPLYLRMRAALGQRPIIAAALLTLASACIFIIPVLLGLAQAAREMPVLANFIVNANMNGLPVPGWTANIPLAGSAISDWWQATLSQPHGLGHLLAGGAVGGFHSARDILRVFGTDVFHRLVDFGLAFLCLFFFYKDGEALTRQITALGSHFLRPERWGRYAQKVPTAIRATVNGLVLVGLAEGALIGVAYVITDLPSPVLWAFATGILAIIPFGAPLAYLCAAALLLVQGSVGGAIGVAVWGTVVLFVADHFVRPGMIGNATRLPFLAVLFGILGGVETLGLVGLFIGPVVMVLFVTLWYEANVFDLAPAPVQKTPASPAAPERTQ